MKAGMTPMSKGGSKSPAPTPGKNTAFSVQNKQAKYGKPIKSK